MSYTAKSNKQNTSKKCEDIILNFLHFFKTRLLRQWWRLAIHELPSSEALTPPLFASFATAACRLHHHSQVAEHCTLRQTLTDAHCQFSVFAATAWLYGSASNATAITFCYGCQNHTIVASRWLLFCSYPFFSLLLLSLSPSCQSCSHCCYCYFWCLLQYNVAAKGFAACSVLAIAIDNGWLLLFILIFWFALLPLLVCRWMPNWSFVDDAATAFADAITPLLLAWCHTATTVAACYHSHCLPSVDINLLSQLLSFCLWCCHCLAATTFSMHHSVAETTAVAACGCQHHHCWLPVTFLRSLHPCQCRTHHLLLLSSMLLLHRGVWKPVAAVAACHSCPSHSCCRFFLVYALLLQSHCLVSAFLVPPFSACCTVTFQCHIFAVATAITAGWLLLFWKFCIPVAVLLLLLQLLLPQMQYPLCAA